MTAGDLDEGGLGTGGGRRVDVRRGLRERDDVVVGRVHRPHRHPERDLGQRVGLLVRRRGVVAEERLRGIGAQALTHVISQAGVLDLRAAVEEHLGTDAALAFLGDADESTYDRADPLAQVPLDVPVWAVHARDDDTVPFAQATTYVDAATAAGAEATLVEVTGGHFGVIDTGSEAWAACVEVLDSISPPR